ncbi:acyl-CoA thioesterase II [Propylenella binzhouense]|uniref:Acyl-CoA thioesterase 2 n=1 Tax=Propylenella binzhouense TaxID=2555902 RepID=A0A964T4S3_9HYPH|nr:acyl-CoA thioesterase II [Propylenella binzhouense]MYZ47864.1 acyl-CoA thioesterase II [Propylenella binzhouense]
MPNAIQNLLDILDLEPLEHNLFRGRSPQAGWQRVFGGQVIGQALVAATRTVEPGRNVHSLHGYFMRPGDPTVPIVYQVDRIRDGKSFTTRRVVAIQHGQAIFSMSASFQVRESGLQHQMAMPDVPRPESLMSEEDMKALMMSSAPKPIRAYWERERPLEFRPVSLKHYVSRTKLEAVQRVWFRATGPLPDDPAIHDCVLAYASDMTLLDTSLFAHGRSVFDSDLQVASLDHAMWFHRPFRADDWLLYDQDSPNASGSRGLTRGAIYAPDGTLVASVAQEGLIRVRQSD